MSASPAAAPGSSGQAVPVGNPNVVTAPGNNNHERQTPTAEHDKIAPRVMPLAAALMNTQMSLSMEIQKDMSRLVF